MDSKEKPYETLKFDVSVTDDDILILEHWIRPIMPLEKINISFTIDKNGEIVWDNNLNKNNNIMGQKKVTVQLINQSDPIEYTDVINVFCDIGMLYILVRDGTTFSHSLINIFKVIDTHK